MILFVFIHRVDCCFEGTMFFKLAKYRFIENYNMLISSITAIGIGGTVYCFQLLEILHYTFCDNQ